MRIRDQVLGTALAILVCASPGTARADEPWMLSIEAAAAAPVTAPQSSRFEPGASGAATVWHPLTSAFALGARFRGAVLTDGAAPADASLVDPGPGGLVALGLGGRLRLEAAWDASPRRATGPWIDAVADAVLTGSLVRPGLEIGFGYGFEVGDVDVGPSVRWLTVFETESQLEPRHANVVLVGVEIVLFDARPSEPPRARERMQRDRSPSEEEDEDGRDHDGDGVDDRHDACPRAPADGDTIADSHDACPEEPEIVNGIDDGDGCPDHGLIVLEHDRIVLEERVLFDLERARVRRRALPVLRAIVELQRQHPEWTELRIEGHADAQGTRSYNQRLSERRAARVRDALVALGIPAEIITSMGHGERSPRAWGDDEATHQRNRRVEFVVVRSEPHAIGGSR